VDTVVCAPDDGWNYHPKHVEQFPGINKLRNVASCWIYIGILLGAHLILHISRISVKIQRGNRGKVHSFLTSALNGVEWSASLHGRFTPLEIAADIH
jgi:hypothetical protein